MTPKENHLAKEMVELIKNIEEHTDQLSTGERIPQLELEIIVAKIGSLYEKAVVLKYLHAHIDDIRSKPGLISGPQKSAPEIIQEETRPGNLHTKQKTEKKSLHEKISSVKSTGTLVDKLRQKTGKNLSSFISLHEKLMFQKELFNGNSEEYSSTIKHLETMENFQEAKKFLEDNFSAKHSWDKKTEALNTLWQMLEKKYE